MMKPPIEIWIGDYHLRQIIDEYCPEIESTSTEYILTTAIKDLPEDKLAELLTIETLENVLQIALGKIDKDMGYVKRDSIYICPECGDSGSRQAGLCKLCPHDTVCDGKCIYLEPCPCLKNPNSIASIKRGGSDNVNHRSG